MMIFARITLTAAIAGVLLSAPGCMHESSATAKRSIYVQLTKALGTSAIYQNRAAGCQSTLDSWKGEHGGVFEVPGELGGAITLGDNYLTYYFVHLSGSRGRPNLLVQSRDETKRISITPTELSELSKLIADARSDPPPTTPRHASHISCIIFWDAAGNYFSVDPDTLEVSNRATDRALALMWRISRSAP